MAASFKLTGDREMARRIRDIARDFPKEAAGAILLEAEEIMTESKREHVPVDLGTLRASGHVQRPEIGRRKVSVTMAYGSAAAPYALAVHEHPSSSSPPSWEGVTVQFHPEGRGPKYLERPFMAARRGMLGRLARRLKV